MYLAKCSRPHASRNKTLREKENSVPHKDTQVTDIEWFIYPNIARDVKLEMSQ